MSVYYIYTFFYSVQPLAMFWQRFLLPRSDLSQNPASLSELRSRDHPSRSSSATKTRTPTGWCSSDMRVEPKYIKTRGGEEFVVARSRTCQKSRLVKFSGPCSFWINRCKMSGKKPPERSIIVYRSFLHSVRIAQRSGDPSRGISTDPFTEATMDLEEEPVAKVSGHPSSSRHSWF